MGRADDGVGGMGIAAASGAGAKEVGGISDARGLGY